MPQHGLSGTVGPEAEYQPATVLSRCTSHNMTSPDPEQVHNSSSGSSYFGSASSSASSSSATEGAEDPLASSSSSSGSGSMASDIIANDLENTDLETVFGTSRNNKPHTNMLQHSMRPAHSFPSSRRLPSPSPTPPPSDLITSPAVEPTPTFIPPEAPPVKHLVAENTAQAPSARKGRVRGTSFSRVHLNASKLSRLSPLAPLSPAAADDAAPTTTISPTHSIVAITSPCSSLAHVGSRDVSHHAELGSTPVNTEESRPAPSPNAASLTLTPDALSKRPSMQGRPTKVGFRVRGSSNARRRKLMSEEEAVHLEVYEEHRRQNLVMEPQQSRLTALDLPSPTVVGFTACPGTPNMRSDGSHSHVGSPVSATPSLTPPVGSNRATPTPSILGFTTSQNTPVMAARSHADQVEEEELLEIFVQVDDADEDLGSPSPSPPARRARGVSVKGRTRGASVASRKSQDTEGSRVRATSSKLGRSTHKHRHMVMVRTILERGRIGYFEACRAQVGIKQQCTTLILAACCLDPPVTNELSNSKSKSSLKLLRAMEEDEAHSPKPVRRDLAVCDHIEDLRDWFIVRLEPLLAMSEAGEDSLLERAFPNSTAVILPVMRCQYHKPSLDFRYCHMFQIPFRILQRTFPDPKGDAYFAMLEEHVLKSVWDTVTQLVKDTVTKYGASAVAAASEGLAELLLERIVASSSAISSILHPTSSSSGGPLCARNSDPTLQSIPPISLRFRAPSFTDILVELHLDHNHLTSLPEDIGAMVHLRRLVASNNRITTVPPSLCVCDELEYLDLSNNLLTTLPAELGDMDSLEELLLDYNRFETIPSCVCNGMIRLRKLFMIENSSLRNMEGDSAAGKGGYREVCAPWLQVRLADWETVNSKRRDAATKLINAHAGEILVFIQDLVTPGVSDSSASPSSAHSPHGPSFSDSSNSNVANTLIPPKLLISLLQQPLVEPLFEVVLDNTPEMVTSYTDLCLALEEGGYEQPARILLQQAAAGLASDRLSPATACPVLAESLGSINKFGSPTSDAASDFLFHHENQQHLRVSSALMRVSWNKVWPDEVVLGLLTLGSLRTVQNPTALHELGITHVLTCGRNLDTPRDFQRIVLADQSVPVSETFEFAATGSLVCEDEAGAQAGRGIRQLVLEVDDNEVQSLDKYFLHAIQFIEGAKKAGGKVVCHCFAGVSRSATVVVAYVMYTMGLSATEALKFVQKGRAAANPNPNFRRQLAKFESACAEHRLRQ